MLLAVAVVVPLTAFVLGRVTSGDAAPTPRTPIVLDATNATPPSDPSPTPEETPPSPTPTKTSPSAPTTVHATPDDVDDDDDDEGRDDDWEDDDKDDD